MKPVRNLGPNSRVWVGGQDQQDLTGFGVHIGVDFLRQGPPDLIKGVGRNVSTTLRQKAA